MLWRLCRRCAVTYSRATVLYGRLKHCRATEAGRRLSSQAFSGAEHPRLELSELSVVTRRRCDKLKLLHNEYYIVSILDGFINLDMVQEAMPLFNFFRRSGHQFDVEVYNKLLFGWSTNCNDFQARLLYNSMEGDEVEPDFQTFAALLDLYSRCNNWEEVARVVDRMEARGFRLKHTLHCTQLSADQTQQIMKILSRFGVDPEPPPSRKLSYPRVVKQLYEDHSHPAPQQATNTQTPASIDERSLLERLFDKETIQANISRQLEIEQKGYVDILSVAKPHSGRDAHKEQIKVTLSQLRTQWKSALTAALTKDIQEFKTVIKLLPVMGGEFRGPRQFPFLALLPPHVWSDILVDQVMVQVMEQPDGLPLHFIMREAGRAAASKYSLLRKMQRGALAKVESMYSKYVEMQSSPFHSTRPSREIWNELDCSTMNIGSLAADNPRWPKSVYIYTIGAVLDRLLQVATVPMDFADPNGEGAPAFEHYIETINDKRDVWKVGYVKAHKRLYELVKKYQHKDEERFYRMSCTLLPMLVPPRPWTSPDTGGYLLASPMVVRCPEDTYQHHLLLEQAENLNAVYDALNSLGSCPWRVNTRVLDLVIELFNSGGDPNLDIPSSTPELPEYLTGEELSRAKRMAVKKLQNESFSLWMDTLYRLSLANHFRDDVFWLPHNMDFRGRVYPIPPHLTHISNDVSRALLKFAVGHPLGEGGLDWLKIHLVNLHGTKKKASLGGRLEYTNSILADVMDSADKPFDGGRWWTTGDSPWQILACCMEITAAIRSGDPVNFVSHIPVHQDGSCNGLQHYAALGRDSWGAKQVNLIPSQQPEDTYNGVAMAVEERRRVDAASGHEIATLLEGKINRKVVKATVMTVVYGVTWIGGRLQVEKQLKGTIPDEKLWDGSNYLVGGVFATLREMFSNARGIQDWLASSARKIALAGRPVEWQTPLGLPVVQPYHKTVKKELRTEVQTVQQIVSSDLSRPPDIRKQKNGMPPNYVHSLDSTHMMLTALHCQRAGVPFVAVHDSFWTHACFVDVMNKFCREQFVALHGEPILQDLAQFMEHKFGGLEYKDYTLGSKAKQKCQFMQPFPTIGDLRLEQTLDSTYFFS